MSVAPLERPYRRSFSLPKVSAAFLFTLSACRSLAPSAMIPTVQKALVIPAERGPWELRTDFPVPSPGPQEILVKLMASALNPIDWGVQTYGVDFIKDYPHVGGADGSGVVEAVGDEVTGFTKGDRM